MWHQITAWRKYVSDWMTQNISTHTLNAQKLLGECCAFPTRCSHRAPISPESHRQRQLHFNKMPVELASRHYSPSCYNGRHILARQKSDTHWPLRKVLQMTLSNKPSSTSSIQQKCKSSIEMPVGQRFYFRHSFARLKDHVTDSITPSISNTSFSISSRQTKSPLQFWIVMFIYLSLSEWQLILLLFNAAFLESSICLHGISWEFRMCSRSLPSPKAEKKKKVNFVQYI